MSITIPQQRPGVDLPAEVEVPEQPTAVLLDRAERIKQAVAAAHEKWATADANGQQQVINDLAAALHAANAHTELDGCLRMAAAILHRMEGR